MTVVAVLGAGVMASALTVPLADNGHDVRLVGTHLDRAIIDALQENRPHPGLEVTLPERVRAFQLEDAGEAFLGAEVVLSGVNSDGVRWASEQLARLLSGGMEVIAIAKGLDASDDGNLRILPEVLVESWSDDQRERTPVCAIVGPSIAGEVANRRATCVVFSSPDAAVAERLAGLWQTEYYRVWTSTEFVGCEVCSAMKNCYALGVGLAEGILERRDDSDATHRMHNYEAALFAQAAREMRQMVDVLGGRVDDLAELVSVGDMYVTSTGGRNVRVGRLLGAGLGFDEAWERLDRVTLEGAAAIRQIGGALPKLAARGRIARDDFPLLRHLYEVIAQERPLDMPWDAFFGGKPAEARG